MAMSAGMIVVTVVLITVIGIVTWYFVVSYKYGKTLTDFSYTRGANLDTLDKNKGSVNLTCESGAEVCVWKANAICSGPLKGSVSNTEGGPEPISNGLNGNSAYGEFDIYNTIDLTTDMATQANGKQSYTYNFDVTNRNFGKGLCPMNYDTKSGTGSRPQLISTYACIPKGSKCQSSKPPTPPTPPPPKDFTQVPKFYGMTTVSNNNNDQICGALSGSEFKVWCVDNYVNKPQFYTIAGFASQLSLSDTGSLLAKGASNNVYHLDNFKANGASWSNITGTVKTNNAVTNRFGTSSTIGGSTDTDSYAWLMPKGGSPTKLAAYGWTTMDSNANGDMCGIVSGNIQYLQKGASSPINIPNPSFNATNVSINKSGNVCATTDKGDIMCTKSYSNSLWGPISTGQGFTSLSINDKNIVCATKKDGTVWCTS